MTDMQDRRPLKTRRAGWARGLAAALARGGMSPNFISAVGVWFAALGAVGLISAGYAAGGLRVADLIAAAVCVQLRLLCNLLDGLVAVEHGKGSTSGPIWNELPDRIADVILLVAAGYAAGEMIGKAAVPLGWTAALLAVLTAYIRALGQGLGFPADFRGPMAKPHRMAALTLACLAAAAEPLWGWNGQVLAIGLALIILGTAATCVRRTLRLAAALKAR
jgi:phosphatidylglycerophosphate synthase